MKRNIMAIGSPEWKKIIADGAISLGVVISPEALDQFSFHATELVHWTKKSNLTAITDPMDIAVKHFIDSVAVAGLIPLQGRLLDVGSGGGFPGLPLKIVTPRFSGDPDRCRSEKGRFPESCYPNASPGKYCRPTYPGGTGAARSFV